MIRSPFSIYPENPEEIVSHVHMQHYLHKKIGRLMITPRMIDGLYFIEYFSLKKNIVGPQFVVRRNYQHPVVVNDAWNLEVQAGIKRPAAHNSLAAYSNDSVVVSLNEPYPYEQFGALPVDNQAGREHIAKLLFNLVNANLEEISVVDGGHFGLGEI